MRMIELTGTEELARALRAAGLPTEDLGRPGQVFWRFSEDEGRGLGFAGLEGEGPDRLLRSVVIDPAARGRGHGRALVDAIAREAASCGVANLWLLTLDAAPFFAKAGFVPVARDLAPAGIAASAEFKSLCPASAVCMRRRVS
ncbi:MAG: arsenic resistance N-acetyltransferase ArsN2 [Alphaproteobacteria bacterium]